MKKQLLNLSFVAVALALYVASAVATPIAPVRDMVVPAAAVEDVAAPPALDGVAEDVYSDVQSTNIFNPTGHDGDADFTAVFQVCWDPTYMYVFAEITDDVEHDYEWGVGNSWEFDNLELFFMLDTNTVVTSYTGTTVQLRVCRALDSVETAGRAPRADYLYYMEAAAAGGWITEVAVPWTCVLADGAAPEDFMDYVDAVIGFDFAGADSDNSDGDAAVGNRDVQSAWDDDDPADAEDRTEDLAWNNTSVFGYITLEASDFLSVNAPTQSSLNAYPNPATDHITFDVEGPVTVEIYSITGGLVMVANEATVDVSSLSSGVYIAQIGDQAIRFSK